MVTIQLNTKTFDVKGFFLKSQFIFLKKKHYDINNMGAMSGMKYIELYNV